MCKYDDLIQRLHAYFMDTGILVGSEAADAIRKLVEELERAGYVTRRAVERAEKAEADLVAARAALRWCYERMPICCGREEFLEHEKHSAAFAAAHAERGE